MAQTLNIEVNKFCKTRLGTAAICLLAWKFLGKELLGIAVLFFFIWLAIWSLKRFLMPYKVVNKDKETKIKHVEFIEPYVFSSGEGKVGCAITHVIFFIVLLIVVGCTLLA